MSIFLIWFILARSTRTPSFLARDLSENFLLSEKRGISFWLQKAATSESWSTFSGVTSRRSVPETGSLKYGETALSPLRTFPSPRSLLSSLVALGFISPPSLFLVSRFN